MQLLQRASLILVNHQQELLLIQRFQNDRHYWVFPGGSVEVGEQPVARRKEKRWKKPHWNSIGSKRFLSSKTKVA